jgi:beta-N-acetylhexosaminidase
VEAKRVKKRKIRKVKGIMPRSTTVFLLVLAVLASTLGYNYFARPFADYQAAQTESVVVEEEVVVDSESDKKLLSTQDLAQLIAFSYSLDTSESTQSALLSWISQNQPGVVTLFGSQISTSSARFAVNRISADFNNKLQPLVAVDHEGGSVQRLAGVGFTDLPSWKSICVASSTQRQNLLEASAREISQVGVELVFAPMIDIASQSAVLKDRVCSSDPEIVKVRAAEFIDTFAQQKIISVIKHYPGIGSISKDLHRSFDEVDLGEEEVLVFKDLLEAYPLLGVMSAHVGVLGRYEDEPCSLNNDCIDDLTNYFPNTLVFTDALDMKSAGYIGNNKELSSLAQRAILAIKAGNDVLVFGPNVELDEFDKVLSALKIAYDSDVDFQKQAEKSVQKIRQYKEIIRQ